MRFGGMNERTPRAPHSGVKREVDNVSATRPKKFLRDSTCQARGVRGGQGTWADAREETEALKARHRSTGSQAELADAVKEDG